MELSEEEKNIIKFSLEFLVDSLNIIPAKKLRKQNLNKVIMINDCKNLLEKIK